MELVIDANVIFASLIKDSTTRRLLLTGNFRIFAPEYLYGEVTEHFSFLSERTGLSETALEGLLQELLTAAQVRFISRYDFKEYEKVAKNISPDPDDTPYVALALKLGAPIWSNDKALKEGQKKVKVYNTSELVGA